jgi:hypothetical protein
MNLRFEAETSQATKLNKRKKINNKEELREQLEKLQVELGTSKVLRISLEEQLFAEEKLRKFVEQQLMEKDKSHVFREIAEREKKWLETKLRKSKENWEQVGCKPISNDCQKRTNMSSGI